MMKYNALVWMVMTSKLKPIVKDYWKEGNVKDHMKKAKGIYKNAASWADTHPEDNKTWKFGFNENLHKEGFYYQFSFCPIAAFCKEKGFPEFTPVLCNIDYITFKLMHANLYRQHTIANGDDICDYWLVDESVENPQ